MTNPPASVTIGGVELTSEDIPHEDWYNAGFGAYAVSTVVWFIANPKECPPLQLEQRRADFQWIAARCRCYFLDKAEVIAVKRQKLPKPLRDEDEEADEALWSTQCCYLFSAAKWALIARGILGDPRK